jgi:hypothetical protein
MPGTVGVAVEQRLGAVQRHRHRSAGVVEYEPVARFIGGVPCDDLDTVGYSDPQVTGCGTVGGSA